ncbi:MAG: leucyl aminopeptidase family protein [Alphaproteobacteria bacterium]|nr:leucyl aminopeptidase family protein [Alphaproteobacteria bacterium]
MSNFKFTLPFTTTKPTAAKAVAITPIKKKDFDGWLKKQDKALQTLAENSGFKPGGKSALIVRNDKGGMSSIYILVGDTLGIYDVPGALCEIKGQLSQEFIDKHVFTLSTSKLSKNDIENALIGWAMAGYQFDRYKASTSKPAILHWPDKAGKKRVEAFAQSLYLVRELINIPAMDFGPAELEAAARDVAKTFTAKVSVIADEKLLEKNFPVIHAVGDAAGKTRRPRLIKISWGNAKHPKLTLVGKGVCYDTGGLNLKPGQYMRNMKKDMGGAAHALSLGRLIMALKLPVNLNILIPAVENAVGGDAFRPGDILKSRKGLFIENTNTDAEGRLVLADSLTYACERKPELVIDFATLTGSARAALGEDVAPFFSTDEKTAKTLQDIAANNDDPLWNMPLHQDYVRLIKNSASDLINSAAPPGDLIYSALFLQQFMSAQPEWLHLDIFAWESNGRPGRAKGGKDTGLRSLFALLESRYG